MFRGRQQSLGGEERGCSFPERHGLGHLLRLEWPECVPNLPPLSATAPEFLGRGTFVRDRLSLRGGISPTVREGSKRDLMSPPLRSG